MADVIALATNRTIRATRLLHGYGIPAHLAGKLLGPHLRSTRWPHRSGYQICIDPTEYSGEVIALCGDYDGRIGEIVARATGPGKTVLDIGAHYGTETLAAARAVGPSGSVHAFEPQKEMTDNLRCAAELNGLDWVHVHQVALGDDDGTVALTTAPIEMGAPNRGNVAVGGEGQQVRMVDAGRYLEEIGVAHMDVVKIDIQGFEAPVLRSLLTAREQLPYCVVFESMLRGVPLGSREEVAILTEHGYEIGELQGSYFRLQVRRVGPRHVPKKRRIDFVALLPDAPVSVRRAIGWGG